MAMDSKVLNDLAEHLHNCQKEIVDTVKITEQYPDMDFNDAYDIQDRILQSKLDSGARLIGFKAGLTSHAKMKQMGVTEPIFGFLVDEFKVPDGGEVKTNELIHPKVEPEIAFITNRELVGPGCHIGTVLSATDMVLPGIEVIDSRYRDFKFDLTSVIADNTSAARFVIGGEAISVRGLNLRTTGIIFEKNGKIVDMGVGAAVLGNPAAAVAMLVNHLGQRGQSLPAGSIILSGGICEAVSVQSGDNIRLHVHGMGSVSMSFV